jgi:hypothetical protein
MESGKHRISLKIEARDDESDLLHYFGLIRDGAAWNKSRCDDIDDPDAWYMSDNGCLYSNGGTGSEKAGHIKRGQIISVEADLDKGTLRFWVDGKQHGLGWSSGVTGRLRWAVCIVNEGGVVEILPTPPQQPWSASLIRPKIGEESEAESDEEY